MGDRRNGETPANFRLPIFDCRFGIESGPRQITRGATRATRAKSKDDAEDSVKAGIDPQITPNLRLGGQADGRGLKVKVQRPKFKVQEQIVPDVRRWQDCPNHVIAAHPAGGSTPSRSQNGLAQETGERIMAPGLIQPTRATPPLACFRFIDAVNGAAFGNDCAVTTRSGLGRSLGQYEPAVKLTYPLRPAVTMPQLLTGT
jgi:hypothetical protein